MTFKYKTIIGKHILITIYKQLNTDYLELLEKYPNIKSKVEFLIYIKKMII